MPISSKFTQQSDGSGLRSNTLRNAGLVMVTACALTFCTTSGCGLPKWLRGPGFNGPNAGLGDGLRGNPDSGPRGTGLDERARQIERNLGYSS